MLWPSSAEAAGSQLASRRPNLDQQASQSNQAGRSLRAILSRRTSRYASMRGNGRTHETFFDHLRAVGLADDETITGHDREIGRGIIQVDGEALLRKANGRR